MEQLRRLVQEELSKQLDGEIYLMHIRLQCVQEVIFNQKLHFSLFITQSMKMKLVK